jgi:hypothetical protein
MEKLEFTIAKPRHMQFGRSAERGAILKQLELRLANLEGGRRSSSNAREVLLLLLRDHRADLDAPHPNARGRADADRSQPSSSSFRLCVA